MRIASFNPNKEAEMKKFRVMSKHPVSMKKKVYNIEAENAEAAKAAAEAKAPKEHEVYSVVPKPKSYISPHANAPHEWE